MAMRHIYTIVKHFTLLLLAKPKNPRLENHNTLASKRLEIWRWRRNRHQQQHGHFTNCLACHLPWLPTKTKNKMGFPSWVIGTLPCMGRSWWLLWLFSLLLSFSALLCFHVSSELRVLNCDWIQLMKKTLLLLRSHSIVSHCGWRKRGQMMLVHRKMVQQSCHWRLLVHNKWFCF